MQVRVRFPWFTVRLPVANPMPTTSLAQPQIALRAGCCDGFPSGCAGGKALSGGTENLDWFLVPTDDHSADKSRGGRIGKVDLLLPSLEDDERFDSTSQVFDRSTPIKHNVTKASL